MTLEMRTQLEAAFSCHRLAEDDAVRIADRDEHGLNAPGGSLQLDLLGLAVETGRQVRGSKRWATDVELRCDLSTVPREDANRVGAVRGAQLEALARAMHQDRMRRRDAQAVAALLRFGTIRVEDADCHGLGVESQ